MSWVPYLRLAGIVYLEIFIHIIVIALFSIAFGVAIKEVVVGAFLRVIRVRLANIPLTLSAVPINGYVKFAEPEDLERQTGYGREHQSYFEDLSTPAKMVIALSGCMALLAIAVAIKGTSAVNVGFAAWEQFFSGALAPFSTAQSYLAEMARFIQTAPTHDLIATIFAKFAAINLLPLGGLNGGMIVHLFLKKNFSLHVLEAYSQYSMLLILICLVSWFAGFVYYFL